MILNLTIDETGSVRKPTFASRPTRSTTTCWSARQATWKYKPAMRNGVPVRYEKTVVVDVK